MELLILGASVRAAAQSARRAGHRVAASDLFGDRDLRDIASFHRADDYPRSFLSIRKRFPYRPLVYTGALENYPEILAELETIGPIYGNLADCVRAVRDPFELSKAFSAYGIPFPETLNRKPDDLDGNAWLVKDLCSAGGCHVRSWHATKPDLDGQDIIFQRRLPGHPVSATFVAAPERDIRFLGATRMLVGPEWGGPAEFSYCGSITEDECGEKTVQWQQIATALCARFELRGVFGVDAIETPEGIVPIEVNPRYTASMEVIECSLPQPVMAYHVAACQGRPLPPLAHRKYHRAAKLIIYADRAFDVPKTFPLFPDIRLADIPDAGCRIEPGRPLLTLIGSDCATLKSTGDRILAMSLALQ